MAINLNRGIKKISSSNRIGSLIGNGLLTFIDYKKFNHFFNNEIIFYHDHKDLSDNFCWQKKIKKERNCRNGQKNILDCLMKLKLQLYFKKIFKLININQFEKFIK